MNGTEYIYPVNLIFHFNLPVVTERLLQFIWQFQYFDKTDLLSNNGETLEILFPGHYNRNQGPDFLGAKIRVLQTTWAGSVELHLRTSDWMRHGHQHDPYYNNVIMHVVWEDDSTAAGKQVTSTAAMPILELQARVPKILLHRYEQWMLSPSFVACGNGIRTVPELTWKSWKERLLVERMTRKASLVMTHLRQTQYHWDETFWRMLARSFGMKVNTDAFEAIARSLPMTLLAKQRQRVEQLEALLLGQGGLLYSRLEDKYSRELQKVYDFQKRKYQLEPIAIPLLFLRMRPVNFPTVRLAQLAMLIHGSEHLFTNIKETESLAEIRKWLSVTASPFWDTHYQLHQHSHFKRKTVGESMIDSILINTIAPVLFAYGDYHRDVSYKEKVARWLEEIMPEVNGVTKGFLQFGIECGSAYDSQALIELKNEYCDGKRCLECAVGTAILRQNYEV